MKDTLYFPDLRPTMGVNFLEKSIDPADVTTNMKEPLLDLAADV